MGKRQTRIFQEEVAKKLPQLLHFELNVVLTNNRSVHGKIISFDKENIFIKDMFLKKHKIPLKEIQEIITDHKTAY